MYILLYSLQLYTCIMFQILKINTNSFRIFNHVNTKWTEIMKFVNLYFETRPQDQNSWPLCSVDNIQYIFPHLKTQLWLLTTNKYPFNKPETFTGPWLFSLTSLTKPCVDLWMDLHCMVVDSKCYFTDI